jgi:hypothetical protein
MTFTTEIMLEVEVEMRDVTRGTRGRLGDRPEHCVPPEGPVCEVLVSLVHEDRRLAIDEYLPDELRDAIASEALDHYDEAAAEAQDE